MSQYPSITVTNIQSNIFYLSLKVSLQSNTWYTMTIAGPTISNSLEAKIYPQPIAMYTVSDDQD